MSGDEQLVEIREAHRFDESALLAYLESELEGFAGGPLRVRQFEGGQSNPTYLVETDSHRYVLRKQPPGELVRGAHRVDREYRILTALRDTEVPVPRTRIACDDPSVIGTPFFVMDYVAARLYRSPRLERCAPDERAAVYRDAARVLAALHAVDYEAVGLGNYGRPDRYYERQIRLWTGQYDAAQTDSIPSMARLAAWLPANIPDDGATSIAHGDVRLENMLLHPGEPRVVALLDWELSTIGHPLADLAWFCLAYHTDSPWGPSLASADLDALGIPSEAAFVAEYCRHSGRDGVDGWPFYLAFAAFRMASILQGVYLRGLRGNAASERALEYGPWVRQYADGGWEIAERGA